MGAVPVGRRRIRRWHTRVVWPELGELRDPSHSAGAMALRGIPVLDPLSATEVNDSKLEPGAPDFNAYPSPPQTGSARALRAMRERPAAPTRAASSLWLTRRWKVSGSTL